MKDLDKERNEALRQCEEKEVDDGSKDEDTMIENTDQRKEKPEIKVIALLDRGRVYEEGEMAVRYEYSIFVRLVFTEMMMSSRPNKLSPTLCQLYPSKVLVSWQRLHFLYNIGQASS